MTTSLRATWLWLLITLGAACFVGAGLVAQSPSGPVDVPQVLVVTLRGKLGTPELARCHRALRDAEARGVAWVVFRCDQDTGAITEDAAELQSLFDHVQQSKVATITLIHGRATQGAACLAVCTDRTYCQPGAQLGEITAPGDSPEEMFHDAPDALRDKRFAAAREVVQSRLDRRKTKLRPDAVKMVLAMADPRMQLVQATVREGGIERRAVLEVGEVTALQGSGAAVLGAEKLTRPLMVDARTAEEVGLSQGTVQDVDHLVGEVLGFGRNAWLEVDSNWAEHMVGWLQMLQPFLLLAGFLLILFEVKTPGVGLPGVLGTAFLALAMFHSYLVGLADVSEIVAFFLGLACLAVEIFLLPGTVVFGVVGFLCLLLALLLSQQSFTWPSNAFEEDILLHNLIWLSLQFVLVLGLGAVLWRVLPKVPWFNRVLLEAPGAPTANPTGGSGLGLTDAALTALVGRVGTAATVLRPTGAMDLDGERIDVVTEGEFVEPGTPVRVLYVQGNRVVVGVVAAPDAPREAERGNVGVVLLLGVLGLALLVAEVFFVSFGVIAACAGLALLGAVFLAFQDSMAFGVAMLVGEAVAAPLVLASAIRLLPRTRFGKQLILEAPQAPPTAAASDPSLAGLLHQTGVSLSPLRPAGFARIGERKVDVVTRGEMLDAHCPIQVVEVAGNRVVVVRRPSNP